MTKYVRAHDGVDVETYSDGWGEWMSLSGTPCNIDPLLRTGMIVVKQVTAEDFWEAFMKTSITTRSAIDILAQILINNGLGDEALAALTGKDEDE